MGFGSESQSSGQVSFWDAVILGITWGLFPGAILAIVYVFIPSINTIVELFGAIVELLGTASLFILFSSLFGAIIGSSTYLVTKSASFVWWALNILAAAFFSACIFLEMNVAAPIIVLLIPIYLTFVNYFSENLPKWIKEAIDRVMVEVLVGSVFAVLFLLLDPLTGNFFSESVKPHLNIFIDRILTIYHNWLHR